MSIQDWTALIGLLLSGLGSLVLVVKWLVKHYLAELKPNGGGSVKDQVNRLETRVDQIYLLLCEKENK
jgi:hypothetical protein